MKIELRPLSVALLVAGLGAAGGSTTVSVQPSSIGFTQALQACPSGTLGAISFTLGHVRVAEGPNVASDIDSENPSAQTVMLSSNAKSATAMVNANKHTVTAKHVMLAAGKRVACVQPD